MGRRIARQKFPRLKQRIPFARGVLAYVRIPATGYKEMSAIRA